ncbi:MAG: FAD-dependent oxidoreductase [Chloroflexi bacterium]|nr:FAD-dependent oxidoreductase [Chloroflexota bacterium]
MRSFPHLFAPGWIGPLRLRNRIISAPMERNLSNEDGSITQRYLDYAAERAKGGAALLLMEATYVDPVGRGRTFQLGAHGDHVIPGLRRLADSVHAHGAYVGVELVHCGRETGPHITGMQPVGPSPVPCPQVPDVPIPRELTIPEINDIVAKFAAAARRARAAGIDIIEVHGAHGYLVNAFLSPYSNRRTDEYGGTLAKRMRFPLEVLRAIKDAVGPDVPVSYRLSADEFLPDGLKLEESMVFSQELERAGVALIDVSAGIYETSHLTSATMEHPRGMHVPLASAIKKVVKHTPVSVAGRINDPMDAERALEEGHTDFVTLARALHADPFFPTKAASGAVDEICRCIGCLACGDLLGKSLAVSCLVNPAAAREREFTVRPATRRKRVVVIGGGPAGMEAARVAALRGHHVTLCERAGELGGQLRYAARVPLRQEIGQLTLWLSQQLERGGVDLRLHTQVTGSLVQQLAPEAIVVATGAAPSSPCVRGAEKEHVFSLLDVLEPLDVRDTRAAVVGGLHHACLTAEHLANRGADVTIITSTDVLCSDVGPRITWNLIERLQGHRAVTTVLNTTVEEIRDGELVLQSRGERRILRGVDVVVWGGRFASDNRLADELLRIEAAPEIHLVGDCRAVRTALEAMHEGAEVGHRI